MITPSPRYERNLILVHTPNLQAVSDFHGIKDRLAERAPDIEVFIVENYARHSVTRRQAAGRPTLIFSPVKLREFTPLRGRIRDSTGRMPKLDEILHLAAGGVRVPRSALVTPETRLDPAVWGPFTVLKPDPGFQGRGVRLVRTRDVRWVDPQSWPADDPRHGNRILAQAFIDTGPCPAVYRVMTVFGRAVYATLSQTTVPRIDLDPAGSDPVDIPIAATVGERKLEMTYDAEVIAFAESVYPAMPEAAVQGVDVVREAATGLLYVVEINPSGLTWHISSNLGKMRMRDWNVDFNAQFGALDIIADALIEATRREAE